MTGMREPEHTSEVPGLAPRYTSQFRTNTPVITVQLELDTYDQWTAPSPTTCPFPSCGAPLGPHQVQLGWSPGHCLRTYRCATCDRPWCQVGPDDPRGRPATEYEPHTDADQ